MSKKGYIFDERFVFQTRPEAERLLKELRACLDWNGYVNVDHLYLLMDLSTDSLSDFNHGWIDLRKAFVTFTEQGYRLCLPPPINLDTWEAQNGTLKERRVSNV